MRDSQVTILRDLITRAPDGDAIEFGVYQGESLKLIVDARKFTKIIGVDSFTGMPAPGPKDVHDGVSEYPEGKFNTTPPRIAGVTFRHGIVPLVLKDLPIGPYAFAHVDLDHFAPTLEALLWLYPRMMPGGVIAADDWFEGRDFLAGGAINEFARHVAPISETREQVAWWIREGKDGA